ncbi:MAG: hypothetical protein ACRDK8_03505, partial [Solirubrobacteraceae bacterium]
PDHEAGGVSATIPAAVTLLLRLRRGPEQQPAADCPAGDIAGVDAASGGRCFQAKRWLVTWVPVPDDRLGLIDQIRGVR